MKGDASLFAAIDLGSNAFRLMIGQSVTRNQQLMIQEVKTLREPFVWPRVSRAARSTNWRWTEAGRRSRASAKTAGFRGRASAGGGDQRGSPSR
jgi:hypothetical protein